MLSIVSMENGKRRKCGKVKRGGWGKVKREGRKGGMEDEERVAGG